MSSQGLETISDKPKIQCGTSHFLSAFPTSCKLGWNTTTNSNNNKWSKMGWVALRVQSYPPPVHAAYSECYGAQLHHWGQVKHFLTYLSIGLPGLQSTSSDLCQLFAGQSPRRLGVVQQGEGGHNLHVHCCLWDWPPKYLFSAHSLPQTAHSSLPSHPHHGSICSWSTWSVAAGGSTVSIAGVAMGCVTNQPPTCCWSHSGSQQQYTAHYTTHTPTEAESGDVIPI